MDALGNLIVPISSWASLNEVETVYSNDIICDDSKMTSEHVGELNLKLTLKLLKSLNIEEITCLVVRPFTCACNTGKLRGKVRGQMAQTLLTEDNNIYRCQHSFAWWNNPIAKMQSLLLFDDVGKQSCPDITCFYDFLYIPQELFIVSEIWDEGTDFLNL